MFEHHWIIKLKKKQSGEIKIEDIIIGEEGAHWMHALKMAQWLRDHPDWEFLNSVCELREVNHIPKP